MQLYCINSLGCTLHALRKAEGIIDVYRVDGLGDVEVREQGDLGIFLSMSEKGR
jgi:hypothetical protein